MTSQVELYNMALGYMGSGSMVVSPNENSMEAIQLNLFYDNARRTVLRDFPYSFAQKRKNLAQTHKPDEYGDFDYAYPLPFDFLKINFVTDSSGISRRFTDGSSEDSFLLFRIVNIEGVNTLLCNLSPCVLDYTADISDLSITDPNFFEMLAYKLASMVCVPLLKSSSAKVQELNQLYAMKLQQAMTNDARSRKQDKKMDTWVSIVKNS